MAITTEERKLLKQLAEAYAFIYDLREMSKYLGSTGTLIHNRTRGIEESIARRREEYPSLFQRYFNAASRRAQGAFNSTKATGKTDGKGKKVPRRQKETPKKTMPQPTRATKKPPKRAAKKPHSHLRDELE